MLLYNEGSVFHLTVNLFWFHNSSFTNLEENFNYIDMVYIKLFQKYVTLGVLWPVFWIYFYGFRSRSGYSIFQDVDLDPDPYPPCAKIFHDHNHK